MVIDGRTKLLEMCLFVINLYLSAQNSNYLLTTSIVLFGAVNMDIILSIAVKGRSRTQAL